MKEYLLPVKIKASSGICDAEKLLQRKRIYQPTFSSEGVAVAKKGYLILDFGREYNGGVRIVVNQVNNTEHSEFVRIRFGESLSETCSEIGTGGATNAHSVRDFSRVLLPSMSDTEIGKTGFRFVRLDFPGGTEIELVAVLGVYEHCGLSPKGSFSCSDSLINEIYETSVRTLYLNLQNGLIFDGIKRDRLVWAGDLNPEIRAALALYGECKNVENALLFSAESAPLPRWMNGLPAYSVWWLISVSEYCLHTGKQVFFRSIRDYLLKLVARIDVCVREDGRQDFREYEDSEMRNFLDWNSFGSDDSFFGIHAMTKIAMQKTEALLRTFGEMEGAERCLGVFRKLQRIQVPKMTNKGAAALCFLAGELRDTKIISAGGAAGMSSFMSYYEMKALARTGQVNEALSMMRTYFGGMLAKGATTFWEDFDVEWQAGSGRIDEFPKPGERDIHGDFGRHCYRGFRHSLCHGWAAGCTAFLPEEILGIHILDTGCATVQVRPALGDLEWAKCEFPTPNGMLRVEAVAKKTKPSVRIEAPDGVRIVK